MKLKLFSKNVNNFSVIVTSAFAEFYFINLPKFKQLCEKYVREAANNLRGNIENGYITLLRTLKEKLELETLRLERNQNKKK